MELRETSFEEFYGWCEEHKGNRMKEINYVTRERLQIIYDYCRKANMKCEGQRCRTTWKNGEWICNLTEPLRHEPTRKELVENLFLEVWCRTEYVARCGRSETELGYSTAVNVYGLKTVKAVQAA